MDYQTQYQEYKALADAALNTYFADTTVSYHRLLEAMHYRAPGPCGAVQ